VNNCDCGIYGLPTTNGLSNLFLSNRGVPTASSQLSLSSNIQLYFYIKFPQTHFIGTYSTLLVGQRTCSLKKH